jgi:hypothetical protein
VSGDSVSANDYEYMQADAYNTHTIRLWEYFNQCKSSSGGDLMKGSFLCKYDAK